MSTKAVIIDDFQSFTTYTLPGGTYNQDHLGLGTLITRKDGPNPEDKWVGPFPVAVARPVEQSTSIIANAITGIRWSDDIDWIFVGETTTASQTRRIVLYEYSRSLNTFNWVGFLTFSLPSAGNHTLKSLDVTYDLHNTGTVGVSGTTVTGTGTTWLDDGVCVNSRIGFGSTDPTQITKWYIINSPLPSNTEIELNTTATITAGTPYVIEDLRIVMSTTCNTATNGGLFVAKGVGKHLFFPSGGLLLAASTTDNRPGTYWLADAAVVTNTVASGSILQTIVDKSTHYIWIMNGTGTLGLYKYNLRAPLTGLASGKSTSAFVFSTSTTLIFGTPLSSYNGCCATPSHGTYSGNEIGIFNSSTNVHYTIPLNTIVGGGGFLSGSTIETAPGNSPTIPPSYALNTIKYFNSIDSFCITGLSSNFSRAYLTKLEQTFMSRIFLADYNHFQRTSGGIEYEVFSSGSSGTLCFTLGGILYLSISQGDNRISIWALPTEADWEYAETTKQRVILPKIDISSAYKLGRVLTSSNKIMGYRDGRNTGIQNGPHRILYRTSGISDNSGAWTVVSQTGDLSAVTPGSSIQFAIEFKTMDETGIPARIYSLAFTYDDISTDSHYQISVDKSSISSEIFAWRHVVPFGGNVPNLRIRLFNAISGASLVDDNTSSPTGTWERSTNGGSSWSAWTNADKLNEETYIRYTPSSLTDGISVRAILTLE